MRADGDRVALAAFASCNIAVAANPIAVRFSNRELPPLWGAGLRFGAAALLLVGLMGVFRLRPPAGRALGGAILFGVLNFAVAVGLAYYAFVHIHAGLGQITYALVPLATLLLAALQKQERIEMRAIVGAGFALGGVAVLAEAPLRSQVPPLALLALLLSVICVAQAAVIVRRLPPIHPITMNAVGSAASAAVLLPLSFLVGESPALPHNSLTWASFAWLVVVGSVVMVILYLVVLNRWEASRAAYVFVLSPFLTLILSAWLDNEPIGPSLFLGGFLILVGVYVGALSPRRASRVEAVAAPQPSSGG
jgi:drug/metabolite transporter (DMT)-like permease